MDWMEIDICTSSSAIEPLTGLLMDCGISGFAIKDAEDFKEFLEQSKGNWDYIEDDLLQIANSETVVTVYLPHNAQGQEQLVSLKQVTQHLLNTAPYTGFYGRLEIELKNINEQDWANNWKQYFKPFPTGKKLLIKPSWETCPPEFADGPNKRTILEIDPASSFGTGQHATTRLCLEMLEKYLIPEEFVLDLGCGSGILSIAALLLGARKAFATDITQNAVETAIENAQKNGFDPKEFYHAFLGDVITDNALMDKLSEQCYQIITANIVADVLIPLLDNSIIKTLLKKDSKSVCILSGIIDERANDVLEAVSRNSFILKERCDYDNWVALTISI